MWLVLRKMDQDSHPQATVLTEMKTCGSVFLGVGTIYIKALGSLLPILPPVHHFFQSYCSAQGGWLERALSVS